MQLNRKVAYDRLCCLLAPANSYDGRELDARDPLWPLIFSVADQNFVLPELHQSIISKGLSEALPNSMLDGLSNVSRLLEKRNSHLILQMDELSAAFNQAGILLVWLKGGALLTEPQGQLQPRLMSDLDLWVPEPDQQELALKVLTRLGYRVKPNAVLSDWQESHHYAPMFHPAHPVSLELHRHIVRKAFGVLLPDTVAASRLDHIKVNGLSAARLAFRDRIMHSLIQASLMSTPPIETGRIRLMKMVDLARLLARDGSHHLPEDVVATITTSSWQAPLERFLTLFERDFLVTNPLSVDFSYCNAVDYFLKYGHTMPKVILQQILRPSEDWRRFLSQPSQWGKKITQRLKEVAGNARVP